MIGALRRFPQFIARHARELVAALDNSQVGWISEDEDVFEFYKWLMESHPDALSEEDLETLQASFGQRIKEPLDDDIPF